MNQALDKSCPSQGVLVEFLQGNLAPPELDRCESHLEICELCHETLRGLAPTDTLSQAVANALRPELAQQNESEDAEIIENLMRRMANPNAFSDTRRSLSANDIMRERAAEVLIHITAAAPETESLGMLAGFQLLELIGAGGTGVVFRARDLSLDREVALKVLRPSLGDLARERFVAEARAAASIDHENVVTIYQVGEQDRLAWIAMKWVPGETLENRLKREGSLGEEETRRLATQVAAGLAEAHRQGLVHRDIKPANLWIGEADNKIRILDFGLVRATDNNPALTATGMLAGTPSFMSPEQAKGLDLDPRSDLFSLGCVMYQMFTGKLPFQSPTILATLQAIQAQQPASPIHVNPRCSTDLSDLTMALLEKQPSERIESADMLCRCLTAKRSDWPLEVRNYGAATGSSAKNTNAEGPVAPSTQTTLSKGFGTGKLIAAGLLGLFGFGSWLFAPQIIRIMTDQGEVEIETDDENVAVEILENGKVVRLLDVAPGASFQVRNGDYEISKVDKDGKTEFEVVRVTENDKVSQPESEAGSSIADASSTTTPEQPKAAVYQGKTLDQWLAVLESDQDPKTQGDALRACATLHIAKGSHEEVMALLQSYLDRHATKKNMNIYREDIIPRLDGLAESLEKLPASKVVSFFETQLKEGDQVALAWTYLSLFQQRDLREISLFSSLQFSSPYVKAELKSRATELLNLLSKRPTCHSESYLLQFIVQYLLKDPAPEEALAPIRSVLVQLKPTDFIKLIMIRVVPEPLLVEPELYEPTKAKILAEGTTAKEREKLVEKLISISRSADGKASFIYEILAEVAGNQLYAAEPLDFENLQTTKLYVKRLADGGKEFKRRAFLRRDFEGFTSRDPMFAAESLLTDICKGLKSKKTDTDEVADSKVKAAANVCAIVAKYASSDSARNPTEAEYFECLQIDQDLEDLREISQSEQTRKR